MNNHYLYIIIFLFFSTATHALDRKMSPVAVISSSQNSKGLKESDLNQSLLTFWENFLVKTTTSNVYRNFAEQGQDPSKLKLNIERNSVFVTVEGKKLAVMRLNLNNLVRHVIVMGIKGNEIYRVTCIRGSNHSISILFGKCGEEVKKTFGVEVNY